MSTLWTWIFIIAGGLALYTILGVTIYAYLIERATPQMLKDDAEWWASCWAFVPLILLGWSLAIAGLFVFKVYTRWWRQLLRRPTDPSVPVATAKEKS